MDSQQSSEVEQIQSEKDDQLLVQPNRTNKTVKAEPNVCTSSEQPVIKSNTKKGRCSSEMTSEDMQVSSTVTSEVTGDDSGEIDASLDRSSDPGTPLQDERPGDSDGEIDGTISPSSSDVVRKTKISSDAEAVGIRKHGGQDDHGELDYNEDSDGDGELESDGEQPLPRQKIVQNKKVPASSKHIKDENNEKEEGEHEDDDGELSDSNDEDCEDGEIRDAETQHKPPSHNASTGRSISTSSNHPPNVCRFFLRGNCTWGMSCRYFHPAPPDKGLGIGLPPPPDPEFMSHLPMMPPGRRPIGPWNPRMGLMLPGPDFDHPMPPMPPPPMAEPIPQESAWERGLRCAKEMLRKANKRKEEEENFEEKRLNLRADEASERTENKENEKQSTKTSYYDEISRDLRGTDDREAEEAWHGGHYENFEVRWMRDSYPPYKDKDGIEMRYEKGQHGLDPRYDKMREDHIPRHRADEWKDPWVRSRSPRPRRSYSRSYSRDSRVRYSSRSVSYSSRSRSSRSRKGSKSSYSSRSTYSSSSSRSSSRSRSRSIPVKRPSGTTLAEDMKAKLAADNKIKSVTTKGSMSSATKASVGAARLPTGALPLKTQMQMSLSAAKAGNQKTKSTTSSLLTTKPAESVSSRVKSRSSRSNSSSSSVIGGHGSRSSSSSSSDSDHSPKPSSASVKQAPIIPVSNAKQLPSSTSSKIQSPTAVTGQPASKDMFRNKQKLSQPPVDNTRKQLQPSTESSIKTDIKETRPPEIEFSQKSTKDTLAPVRDNGDSRQRMNKEHLAGQQPGRSGRESSDVRAPIREQVKREMTEMSLPKAGRETSDVSGRASRDKLNNARGDRETEFTTRGGRETIEVSIRNLDEPTDIRGRGSFDMPMVARGISRDNEILAKSTREKEGGVRSVRDNLETQQIKGNREMMEMPVRNSRDGNDPSRGSRDINDVYNRGYKESRDATGKNSRDISNVSFRGNRDEMYMKMRDAGGDVRGRGDANELQSRNNRDIADSRSVRNREELHSRNKRENLALQSRSSHDVEDFAGRGGNRDGGQNATRASRYDNERTDRDDILVNRGRDDSDVALRPVRDMSEFSMSRSGRDVSSRDDMSGRNREGGFEMSKRSESSRSRGVPAPVPPPTPLSQQPLVPITQMKPLSVGSSHGYQSTSGPASIAAVSSTKDPMKMSGQKSGIKLTLKNEKRMIPTSSEASGDRKRLSEDGHEEPHTKRSRDDYRSSKADASSKGDSHSSNRASGARRDSTSSRRDELLRQLKAVEEAIHRKRNK